MAYENIHHRVIDKVLVALGLCVTLIVVIRLFPDQNHQWFTCIVALIGAGLLIIKIIAWVLAELYPAENPPETHRRRAGFWASMSLWLLGAGWILPFQLGASNEDTARLLAVSVLVTGAFLAKALHHLFLLAVLYYEARKAAELEMCEGRTDNVCDFQKYYRAR